MIVNKIVNMFELNGHLVYYCNIAGNSDIVNQKKDIIMNIM